MSRNELDRHLNVSELVPWYLNGTLREDEAERVKEHVSGCGACRDELARCQDVQAAVHWNPRDAWEPPPGHLPRLMARIDAAGPGATPARRGWRDLVGRWLGWLSDTPPMARGALAFQGALVAGLAGLLLWPTAPEPLARYETRTRSVEVERSAGVRAQAVFSDSVSHAELRALLRDVGASIVRGPSAVGVYELALPADADLSALLETLRASPVVQLAEPL